MKYKDSNRGWGKKINETKIDSLKMKFVILTRLIREKRENKHLWNVYQIIRNVIMREGKIPTDYSLYYSLLVSTKRKIREYIQLLYH